MGKNIRGFEHLYACLFLYTITYRCLSYCMYTGRYVPLLSPVRTWVWGVWSQQKWQQRWQQQWSYHDVMRHASSSKHHYCKPRCWFPVLPLVRRDVALGCSITNIIMHKELKQRCQWWWWTATLGLLPYWSVLLKIFTSAVTFI